MGKVLQVVAFDVAELKFKFDLADMSVEIRGILERFCTGRGQKHGDIRASSTITPCTVASAPLNTL